MSWDEPGSFHVDHVKPIKAFLDEDPDGDKWEIAKRANHFSNLQPLLPADNLRKGAKYEP